MIYTLDYIEKEAESIASSWNGSDERFMHDGDNFSDEDAQRAIDLIEKIKEVRESIKSLGI
jgi:hypothetical protein